MLNTVNLFIALVVAAITYGTPLLFGTLGEVLTEKSGSLNLGVEGIMFMGGAIGLGGVFYYEKAVESPSAFLAVLIGLLCAFIAGGIASLIFSFLTITLRANQNVTGLALTIFGTGVGQYIGEIMRIREGGFVAVGNDLNTSLGVTAVYDALKADTNDATKRAVIADFDKVLGLDLLGRAATLKEKESAPVEGAEEIEALIAQRAQAKKEKNWAQADAIRAKVAELTAKHPLYD